MLKFTSFLLQENNSKKEKNKKSENLKKNATVCGMCGEKIAKGGAANTGLCLQCAKETYAD